MAAGLDCEGVGVRLPVPVLRDGMRGADHGASLCGLWTFAGGVEVMFCPFCCHEAPCDALCEEIASEVMSEVLAALVPVWWLREAVWAKEREMGFLPLAG